jgi:hypothetical protein
MAMHERIPAELEMNEREVQEWLLHLAGVYRGLSRRELAQALGRDASSLFPANGNPKLDYLGRLAEVLDWPVGVVAETILDRRQGDAAAPGDATFDALDEAARKAHADGDYPAMRDLAHQMDAVARTPDEIALAALRESGAHDGMGRYTAQLDALRRGLQAGCNPTDLRQLLKVNLANAHYTLWYLFEARSMARELITEFDDAPPEGRRARAAHAFGHYVLGHAYRRLLPPRSEPRPSDAKAAQAALGEAVRLYTDLADEFDHAPWRGIVNTCRGALLEVEVELGDRGVDDVMKMIDEETMETDAVGDLLESKGWWCIFGCNVAMRHMEGRDLQRHVAGLARRGRLIAERLGNWAMRERLFTLELTQREQLNDLAGIAIDWTMDRDDVRVLIGTMGRFPSFRRTGWRILHRAKMVEST